MVNQSIIQLTETEIQFVIADHQLSSKNTKILPIAAQNVMISGAIKFNVVIE